ncbi:MAG TPA: glycine oxidase ThiO [Microlunatus sp.]|nr:glycine oxidase ThiO [Microlunatus sp.]
MTPDDRRTIADVLVVGGGLIGTAIAWRLAQAGRQVRLVAGEPEAAASRVAAGMLAPVTEISFTEQMLLPLNLASVQRYAGFADEVEAASDLPAGLSRTPTISVAYDGDDLARLMSLKDFLDRLGLGADRLFSREVRRLEPLLSPQVTGGLLVEADWSVDNRLLWAALGEAARRAGVLEVRGFAHHVRSTAGRVSGVTLSDGRELDAPVVVLACGAWAGQITGITPVPVRPVKGQILRLDPHGLPQPAYTVRAVTRGSEVYLVPRASGREVVVGATVEEKGFDHSVTADGVYELLRDARRVLPMTAEYALTETAVGWRPGTPDNAPILGPGDIEGLVLATGHYRNGVLLTPITADLIGTYVLSGELPDLARPFTVDRFPSPAPPGGAPHPSPATAHERQRHAV